MIQLLALIFLVTTHTIWCRQENPTVSVQPQNASQPVAVTKITSEKSEPVKRRRGDLCKTIQPTKRISELGYTEIKAKRDACLAQNDKETALKYAEKMVPLCDDLSELSTLTLDIADLHHSMGSWEKAGKMYSQFAQLYPGSTKVEYALYRAITCNFKLVPDENHDQTRTKEVIELATTFLAKSALFITYTNEVAGIRTQCYQRLFDHENSIVAFYLDQGKLKSAQTRLANMRKEFIALLPTCEQKLLEDEIECAVKMNNITLANEKSTQLAARFPDTKRTVALAQQNKRRAVEKF